MLLGILGASSLKSILAGWGINRTGKGRGINRDGKGIERAGYGNKNNEMNFYLIFTSLILPHPLTNFEIQKYYQNDAQQRSTIETRFSGVYSRDNLSDEIKNGA